MKITRIPYAFAITLTAINAATAQTPAGNAMPVTIHNFIRAETDLYMSNIVKDGGFGKFTHAAAMAILGKLDSGFGTDRRVAAFASATARLLRAYAMQMEVLRRLRNGGQQSIRVEHVHIDDGGLAVIGNVKG
jgi:hypothetical protein